MSSGCACKHTLDHLSGYDGARPVRIGNGAWDQRQHDVWGVLLDSVYLHVRSGQRLDDRLWAMLKHQVQAALENWQKPDQGLWEVRGPAQHFTASKVLCWVAADRGAKLAELRGELESAEAWREAADVIHADVCANGTDDRGVFCQHYDTTALDASNLLVLLLGFLPREDPRVRATVLAIADELTEDELVLRYHVEETDDGFSGEEGTSPSARSGGFGADRDRRVRAGPSAVREAALLRQPAAPVRRGDRRAQRASPAELPASVSHLALVNAVVHLVRIDERLSAGAGVSAGQDLPL